MAVAEKSASCEAMLEDISAKTSLATESKQLAEAKGKEIAEQSVVIVKEKVTCFNYFILVQKKMIPYFRLHDQT